MRLLLMMGAAQPAGKLYDWLDSSHTETGTGLWAHLFGEGLIAGGYRLFNLIGCIIFVFFLIYGALKCVIQAGNPRFVGDFKNYLIRWSLLLLMFLSVDAVIGFALWLGGTL